MAVHNKWRRINAIESVVDGFSHHAQEINTIIPEDRGRGRKGFVNPRSYPHASRSIPQDHDRNAILEALNATPMVILAGEDPIPVDSRTAVTADRRQARNSWPCGVIQRLRRDRHHCDATPASNMRT